MNLRTLHCWWCSAQNNFFKENRFRNFGIFLSIFKKSQDIRGQWFPNFCLNFYEILMKLMELQQWASDWAKAILSHCRDFEKKMENLRNRENKCRTAETLQKKRWKILEIEKINVELQRLCKKKRWKILKRRDNKCCTAESLPKKMENQNNHNCENIAIPRRYCCCTQSYFFENPF